MSANALISSSLPNAAQIIVRPLTADDFADYRALRQTILDLGDGKYFCDSYTREQSFTAEQHWRDWCTETQEHCIIGTFIGGRLAGVMGVVMYGTPDMRTVEWEATWLDPQYRNIGIARLAYEMVEQWTKDRGYQYAVVFIRDDNMRSQEIRKKQGAVYFYTKRNEVWADGSSANSHCYTLDLYPAEAKTYGAAAQHIETILATLKREAPDATSETEQPDNKENTAA